MAVETFLEKFELFANAPNAVEKMRELVLSCAMSGRLVPQDWSDEPAEQSLDRWPSTVAARFLKLAAMPIEMEPFSLPNGWVWVRLPQMLRKITDGTHHSPLNAPAGAFKYVTAKNIKYGGVDLAGITYVSQEVHAEIYSRCDPELGDILFIKDGATTGVATVNQLSEPFSMLSSVALLKPTNAIYNRYLLWALRSPSYYDQIRAAMKGAAITRVNLAELAESLLPLPPLAEQKRIVAKVDELMALCDRLEAQQQERATKHADLARAALARFAEEPTPANLRFLFHDAYGIDPDGLRELIITIAMRGRLLAQDASSSNADVLRDLKRDAIDKESGEDNSPKPVPIDEQPFDLPATWAWARMGDIANIKHGYAFSSEWFTAEPAPFVLTTPGNFYERGGFRDRGAKTKYYRGKADPSFILVAGDLIIPMTEQAAGLLGSPAFVPDDGKIYLHNQRLGKLCIRSKAIDPQFVFWFCNSSLFRGELARTCTGMKVRHTSPKKILCVPFPICSLAEQRRIVAKVEELMRLIDRLEQQLPAAGAVAQRLMAAVVAELTRSPLDRDELAAVEEKPDPAAARIAAAGRFACYVLHRLSDDPELGRTKLEKCNHLAESHCGVPLDRHAIRGAHGPVDYALLKDAERWAGEQGGFATDDPGDGKRVTYAPGPVLATHVAAAEAWLGDRKATVDRLLDLLASLNTRECEVVATAYAAWNDLLIAGASPDDRDIIREAKHNWHEKKTTIPDTRWFKALRWLEHHCIVPRGNGRPVARQR